MPIRINLLAEHFYLEEQKRRDPVKRAILACVGMVVLAVAYSVSVFLQAKAKEHFLAAKQADFRTLEGKYKQAKASSQLRSETQLKLDMVEQLAVERFLWAPSLNALQACMIPGIQITKISVDPKSTVVDSIKESTDSRGTKKPGKKGSSSEEVVLNIEGKDFEKAGQENHLKFQRKLADFPFFKTNLVVDGIRLTKQDPPAIDPETSNVFAIFSFACTFPKRVWDAK